MPEGKISCPIVNFIILVFLKKIATILLLGILLFNWFGYRVLTVCLENSANRQLEAKLDNNHYSESELISIKVPASHLSYYNSSSQFERVDGQTEIDGIPYKYVKRRLYNDSIELLCLPNHAARKLGTAKNEFFKLVNDLQQSGQNKKSSPEGSYKSFSTDYYTLNDTFSIYDLHNSIIPKSFHYLVMLSSHTLSVIGHPPERTA